MSSLELHAPHLMYATPMVPSGTALPITGSPGTLGVVSRAFDPQMSRYTAQGMTKASRPESAMLMEPPFCWAACRINARAVSNSSHICLGSSFSKTHVTHGHQRCLKDCRCCLAPKGQLACMLYNGWFQECCHSSHSGIQPIIPLLRKPMPPGRRSLTGTRGLVKSENASGGASYVGRSNFLRLDYFLFIH